MVWALNRSGLTQFSLLLLAGASCLVQAKPIELIDDWKRSVIIDDQVSLRIASLAPHATELVAAAGLLAQLIAVDSNSDFPLSVKALPKLTAYPRIELEGVISQRVTLLILWGAGLDPTVIDKLKTYGIAVFVSEPKSAADIVRNLQQLGRLNFRSNRQQSGRPDGQLGSRPDIQPEIQPDVQRTTGLGKGAAELAIDQWQKRLTQLEAQYASKPPVPYFLQVWQQPLMALSDQSLQGEASRICAGKNVFAQGTSAAPQTDIEAVITRKPRAWLVAASSSADAVTSANAQAYRDSIKAKGYTGLWITLDDAQLQRPGPRWLDGVQAFCAALNSAR